jgi:hypothetical protein
MKRIGASFELNNGRIINPDVVLSDLTQNEVITFGLYEITPGQFAYVLKGSFSGPDIPYESDLTKEEAIEVADYMINEWTKFKDSLK